MSAAFCRSTSAALARSSRSFDSASSALAVQSACELVEPADRPPHLLDVGDRARRGGADLDQSLFHLEDDHPDHPRRVFRPVEKLGHVRREDVASAAEHGTAEPAGDRGERARSRSRPPSPAAACGPEPGLRGFRVQALTDDLDGVGTGLGRADRGADRDGAHRRARRRWRPACG